MTVVLDVEVAPFLLVANAIFLVLHHGVEHFFSRAENVYRETAIKKGMRWRGFRNPRSSRRLEELCKSKGQIRKSWILTAVLLSLATLGASFAAEAGISTRIDDRVRGTIEAHSQFGELLETNEMECGSPAECEPLQRYLARLLRSGDFSLIKFRTGDRQSEQFYHSSDELELVRSLPSASEEHPGQFRKASFQACLQFSSAVVTASDSIREELAVVAENCGSIEEKHRVDVFVVEPEIMDFNVYHPDGQNASYVNWFADLWGNASFVRPAPSNGRIVVFKIVKMNLSPYLQRSIPAECEIAEVGGDEEGLRMWVFVCPGKNSDFYLGSIREWPATPQHILLHAFRLASKTENLRLNLEDVMDAMVILSPSFINSAFSGIEGSMLAFKSFVYGVLMSMRFSRVQTMKPAVLVVVSISWLVLSVCLLLLPLIIFKAASYANSLSLPAMARCQKLDLPFSASELHRAAIKALFPFTEDTPASWAMYEYGLGKSDSSSNKLCLGWTMEPSVLKDHEISPI